MGSNNQEYVFLITAATGQQSSATIRSLSAWSYSTSKPITIHATTRDTNSPSAQSLLTHTHSNATIKLFQTNFNDVSSIEIAAKGATHALINVTPDFTDFTSEGRHGLNIVSAIKNAASKTLERVVYTSVAGLKNPNTYVNLRKGSFTYHYLTNKWEVQEAVKKAAAEHGWSWTITQPGTFFTNFMLPAAQFLYPQMMSEQKLVTAVDPDKPAGFIDVPIIGEAIAAALTSEGSRYEEHFKGKEVQLVTTVMTFGELTASMTRELAKHGDGKVRIEFAPIARDEAEKVKDQNPLVEAFLAIWDNPVDYNSQQTEALGIALPSVEEVWAREAEALKKTVGLA